MNEIVNKFLLAGDKFMPEMHLKQPGFTYSACGPFTKNKERIQKFKETGDTSYIYKTELDKACFLHDNVFNMTWLMQILKIQQKDKVLRDEAFNIAKNPTYDGYQRGLASMVYKLFDKKSVGSGVNMQAISYNNWLKNYTNQFLENFKKEHFILDLKIIFGVLIQLICN